MYCEEPTGPVTVSTGVWASLKSLHRWVELHRERELLAQLSDEALHDIWDLSRADVLHESVTAILGRSAHSIESAK
jgi:uncharacterized protein YjiS (DUF1127 family)